MSSADRSRLRVDGLSQQANRALHIWMGIRRYTGMRRLQKNKHPARHFRHLAI
jgi:CO dehydrogenase/acetyl-CoA synthase epsilon subunit